MKNLKTFETYYAEERDSLQGTDKEIFDRWIQRLKNNTRIGYLRNGAISIELHYDEGVAKLDRENGILKIKEGGERTIHIDPDDVFKVDEVIPGRGFKWI